MKARNANISRKILGELSKEALKLGDGCEATGEQGTGTRR